jgi:hypothetical protein
MAIQVNFTGDIGSDHVAITTNAASEYTLDLLLKATIASGLKNENVLKDLAKKANLENDGILAFDQTAGKASTKLERFEAAVGLVDLGFKAIVPYFKIVESALAKLSSSTGQGSELLKSFGGLGLGLGAITDKYGKLLAFQEENMKSYQQITTAGVNFGGNLTQLREAIGDTNLTVDQFTRLMTENSQTFARMGGSVDDGRATFQRLSREMFKPGGVGEGLRSLGLSFEDVNQSMAKYLAVTGPRTSTELENTKQITESTAAYVEELDRLAKFTGQSRKQIEDEQAKANLNAAYQRKKATLNQEERDKLTIVEARAAASKIPGAMETVMERVLGFTVPVTEASKNMAGYAGEVYSAMQAQAAAAVTQGKTQEDVDAQYDRLMIAARHVADGLGTTGDYMVLQQGKQAGLIQGIDGFVNAINSNNIRTVAEAEAFRKKLKDEQDKQTAPASQAREMSQIQGQMLEASRALNNAIQKLVTDAMPGIKTAVKELTDAVKNFSGMVSASPDKFNTFYNALAIIGGVISATSFVFAARNAGNISRMLSTALGRTTMSGPGGGGAVAESIFKKPGFLMTAEEKIAERSARMAAERGASSIVSAETNTAVNMVRDATKITKGIAGLGTALTVGFGVKDYFNAEKDRKEGRISAEEAAVKKGGAIGKTAGALGGFSAGAAAGGALGTAFFGVGAVPGAILGGLVGAGVSYLAGDIGESIGESLATKDKSEPLVEEEKRKKAEEDKTANNLKIKTSEENLLEGVNRLNNTMDKILGVMRETAENTEKTAKEVNGNGWFQRKAH